MCGCRRGRGVTKACARKASSLSILFINIRMIGRVGSHASGFSAKKKSTDFVPPFSWLKGYHTGGQTGSTGVRR